MIEAGEIGPLAVQYELDDPELDALEFQDHPLDGGREPDSITATVSPSIAFSVDSGGISPRRSRCSSAPSETLPQSAL